MRARSINIIIFIFLTRCFFAQETFKYRWPLDSPFVITGNYGEIRPNHFHAGIDFSTNGKVDVPVYAVEDGYVSRIRVSPYGYGKCVYVTHNDGKVSVYAHLNSFSLKLDQVVRKQQYDHRKYEVDFTPKSHILKVKKAEVIALSGNTGGSTGPHLHFEIRDEKSEVPLNPLRYYRLSDRTAPELFQFAIYNLSDTVNPKFLQNCRLRKNGGDSLYFEKDKVVLEQSIIGVAFAGIDRIYAKGNPNNIYSAEIFFDDKLIYSHYLNEIAFSEGRYVNEFCDVLSRVKFQKCFLPTLYPQNLYREIHNKGRILLADTLFHSLRLKLTDESGNHRIVQLQVKTRKYNFYKEPSLRGDAYINCAENTALQYKNFSLYFPSGALYNSRPMSFTETIEKNLAISFLPSGINFNKAFTLSIAIPEKLKPFKNKILLKDKGGVILPVNRKDSLIFSLKEFTRYALTVDSTAPSIKTAIAPGKIRDTWKMESFSFIIKDDLSGIGKYDLYLNNTWIIAEYDGKSDKLTYFFNEDTPMGLLQFRLEVEDKVGNRETFFYLLKK